MIDHPDAFRHRAHMGFDHFRDNCVRYHESQAAIYKSDLKTQTARFDAWKQTKAWAPDRGGLRGEWANYAPYRRK